MDRSSSNVLPEDFDSLLTWLDPDREHAREKYETIRQQLIKMFTWQQCSDPEGLADETIARVTQGASEIRASYVGDPSLYFYGVARNLFRESHRQRSRDLPVRAERAVVNEIQENESDKKRYDCLDKCLLALPLVSRELLLTYYESSKQEKINTRKVLADQLGLSPESLRIRVFRIRTTLEKCIERCMEITSAQLGGDRTR